MKRRWRGLRQAPEAGSALAVALVVMMLFGIWIGSVLQFAATDQRIGASVADKTVATYSGNGAIDAAINAIRGSLSTGAAAQGTTTCFTLPSGALDNSTAVSVTCEPTATSASPATSSSQPSLGVVALSPRALEGVVVASGTTSVRGGVAVNSALLVAPDATLDSTGYPVTAGTCPGGGMGTVKDGCTTIAGIADPDYAGPSTAPAAQPTLPACAATVTLQPGIYRSAAALQAVLNCANATIVLSTGTYFFDFVDGGTHEVVFNGGSPRNSRLIGGSVSGSTCVRTAPGVDLSFGGDSRLTVQSGTVDLCSLVPSGNTTAQHIVLRGLKAPVSVPTTSTVSGVSATSVGTTAWGTPNRGAVIDTALTTTTLANLGARSAILRVALPATTVPADATNISATITVRERITTTNVTTTSTATLRAPSGTTIATRTLFACTTSSTCTGVLKNDTAPVITGLTAAQLNGSPTPATVDITLSKTVSGSAAGGIDGLVITLNYDLPIRQVCTLTSPTGTCVAGSTPPAPLLLASGSYATTPLALHGTVYAPTSSVDLRLTAVSATVIDRGIVVRHLLLSMTPAAGAPAMISIPDLPSQPRVIVLVATDASGSVLARARVTFSDGSGGNGGVPTVDEWSVQ